MTQIVEVKVPDIGDFKDVPIIEVLVKVGDTVKAEDSLITLESDKATMDVPSPVSGVVREIKLKVGDAVSEGSLVALVESGAAQAAAPAPAVAPRPQQALRQHRHPLPQRRPRSKCACRTLATSRTCPSSNCWSRSATRSRPRTR
jgi:pyruvate/2-oxoglutarate dehydrogenase complex dihydrolipoamide acyltransferase (E2) component